MRYRSVLLTAIVGVVVGAVPANAEIGGTFALQVENDSVTRTDRHYTHGTRVSWVSDPLGAEHPWAAALLAWLYPAEPEPRLRVGMAAGQNIYTPNNIRTRDLIKDDRPYAGWLYVAPSLHAETRQRIGGLAVDVLDTAELEIGIVGQHSYAEDTQKQVHNVISAQRPNGWRNQVNDEPGLMVVLERKLRTAPALLGGLEFDALPTVGVDLGNVDTSLSLGLLARVGQGLRMDYGPPLIRPNLSAPAFFEEVRPIGWYLFAGVNGSAVAYNTFLDGDTFRDSHSVDKEPLVGNFVLGAALAFQRFRIGATYVLRTREFDKQTSNDSFGALTLSARF